MIIEEIKQVKQEMGYSYEKLSELSGVPVGTIRKILTGETKKPRYETLCALSKVLKKSYTYNDYYVDDNSSVPASTVTTKKTYSLNNADKLYTYNYDKVDMVCEPSVKYNLPSKEKKQGEYTLDDYYAIPDEYRVELIDGVIYDMGAPTSFHQIIAGEIHRQISNFILDKGRNCIPFISPIDVQLDNDEKTMLEPDIIIICNRDQIIPRNILGAPDFVLEVISPGTKRKDYTIKLSKYQNAGVREYWLVDPYQKTIIVYFFESETSPTIYPFSGKIPVNIYNGELEIDFSRLIEWLPE